MLEKKVNLTHKIGRINDLNVETPVADGFSLRRCENQNLHPVTKPISNVPGLNPDCENIAKYHQKEFRSYKCSNNSSYVGLCRQGGRKELLHYLPNPTDDVKEVKRPVLLDLSDKNQKSKRVSTNSETEVPLIDQILSKRENQQNCRSEIQPVDDKAKLYFAYNRNSGTITRVIATSPRPFKFGKH